MSWFLILLGILFITAAAWKSLGYILGAICVVYGFLFWIEEEWGTGAKAAPGCPEQPRPPFGAAPPAPYLKPGAPERWDR